GKYLTAFGDDGLVRIWDWVKGKELGKVASAAAAKPAKGTKSPGTFTTSNLSKALLKAAQTASGTAYAPDGKTLLLYGGSRVLQLIDLPTGKEIGPVSMQAEALLALLFTPDGKHILTK